MGTSDTGSTGRRRFLWHAVSLAILLLATSFLFYKHFSSSGMLMHVDMTFPTTVDRNLTLYNHTWWQYGSVQNIWNLQRVFWAYPLLGAVKLLGLSMETYLLVLFAGTFALAGVSMYALCFDTVARMFKDEKINLFAVHAGCIFAGLVFMYNPFSLSHLWPYFGYPGYAALPLAFLLLAKVFRSPKAWTVVLLSIVLTVAGTSPINVIWYWFMIAAFAVFHLVAHRFSRKSFVTIAKVLLPVAALFAVLNFVWILPYTGSQVVSKPFNPSYIADFSRPMLDALSESGTVLNNLRFTAGWGLPVAPPVGTAWVLLSYALPLGALVSILVLRKRFMKERTMLFWSIMFVISIMLATGTSFVLAGPYSWLVLKAPVLSNFGWVFRAADRWLAFAAVFYSLALGALLAHLLKHWDTVRNAGAEILAVLVLASFVPIALSYAKNVYNPTSLPSDYASVIRYLDKVGARPIWMPFSKDGFRHYWAPEKRVGAFSVYSSNPSLNNLQDLYNRNNYFFWLESLYSKTLLGPGEVLNRPVMLPKDLASRFFVPLAGKHIVYDSSVPGYTMLKGLKEDPGLYPRLNTTHLSVFELQKSGAPLRSAMKTLRIDNNYDVLAVGQKLTPDEFGNLSFAGRNARIPAACGSVDIDAFKVYYPMNSGFEEVGRNGDPVEWMLMPDADSYLHGGPHNGTAPTGPERTPAKTNVRMTVDRRNKVRGKQSLKMVNSSATALGTYSVAGREIRVEPEAVYNISTNVKHRNSKWTHVRVEGYDKAKGAWVRLVSCPPVQSGTADWEKSTCSFCMPAGIEKIRPMLSAGWAENRKKGPGVSWFDDVKLSRIDDRLFSALAPSPPPELSYRQVSPESYEITVKGCSSPFMLSLAEAFDPLWSMQLEDGTKVEPVRLYFTTTGFPVDRSGDFKLKVEYTPQKWFNTGLLVSLVSMGLCLGFLCFVFFRSRRHHDLP